MMQTIVLQEFEQRDLDIDHHAAVTLRNTAGRALLVLPTDHAGRWSIRSSSLVGTVVTPTLRVLIRPKVSDANLFHLLGVAGDRLNLGSEVFEYQRSNDLVPAFATFFARHLEQAVARGVVRRYREGEERLNGVRGRVDLRAQTRMAGLAVPVDCRFDEHSADHQLNRIVASAIVRLVRLPGVSPNSRQTLLRSISLFEEVAPLRPSDLRIPTTFTRLDRHFRPVEHLARLVIAGSSLLDAAGSSGASTFTIDMNRLFEQFVEDRLRRYLRGQLDVVGQSAVSLDHGRHVRMRPDLVFREAGRPAYVGDSKYKLTADGYGRESDYYQLLAYCTALELPAGMLIYCHADGALPPRQVTVRGPQSRTLTTAAVRLDGSPTHVEERMRLLAGEIADRATESSRP